MGSGTYALIPVVAGSYLIGSIPTGYLLTRWARGSDIRQRGSGQVGGSNVWNTVSHRMGIVVAILDVFKGIAVILVARLVGLGEVGQVSAMLAVLCGHNWSVFLRFSGGRGIASLAGAVVLLAPREIGVFAVFLLLGLMGNAVPVGAIAGVAAMPAAAWYFHEPQSLVFGLLAAFVIMLLKRVVPRRRWPSTNRKRVLLYRALFDRDVRSRREWIGHREDRAGKL